MAKPARDSQWGKIRDAISDVDDEPPLYHPQLQTFVDTVLRSRWFRNRYRVTHPEMVKKAKGLLMPPTVVVLSRATAWQPCEANYHAMDHKAFWTPCTHVQSPTQPSVLGALHVLSHLIVTERPLHCPEWAMTYLKMVQQFGTDIMWAEVRASFKHRKVKTFTWSDDAKAAAKVRAAEKQFRTAGERARALVAALEAED